MRGEGRGEERRENERGGEGRGGEGDGYYRRGNIKDKNRES